MIWFELFSHILLTFLLGYYLITNLQLYSYRFKRIILHHAKPSWHMLYFLIPIFAYYLTGIYFWFYFYLAYLPALYLWNKKLDKKLIFTARVKRFFAILALLLIVQNFLCLATQNCQIYGVMLPLLFAFLGSSAIELLLFTAYKNRARTKLASMQDMIVIGITASYGKTSIKNFLSHLLQNDYTTYKTPRSVNTLGGIVKDINEDLPKDTQVYIVEMGARQRGDIKLITDLIAPHYVIVGKIGPAHIEYFKSLENIRDTKLEAIYSKRLKKAFVHHSAHIKPHGNICEFKPNLDIKSSLEALEFEYENQRYSTPLLGKFNADNIALALAVAKELDAQDLVTKVSSLQPVPHRLQKIQANGKLIIDDSYNGNIDGMLESFELVQQYTGRKVLITAGLIEADEILNTKVAKKANEVFDLVIITSNANYESFFHNIDSEKFLRLRDKSKMQEVLADKTRPQDLILFANDAPNFI
ncbi:MAG: Mur ligase family protein [Campylobacterota bacterium]